MKKIFALLIVFTLVLAYAYSYKNSSKKVDKPSVSKLLSNPNLTSADRERLRKLSYLGSTDIKNGAK